MVYDEIICPICHSKDVVIVGPYYKDNEYTSDGECIIEEEYECGRCGCGCIVDSVYEMKSAHYMNSNRKKRTDQHGHKCPNCGSIETESDEVLDDWAEGEKYSLNELRTCCDCGEQYETKVEYILKKHIYKDFDGCVITPNIRPKAKGKAPLWKKPLLRKSGKR